MIRCDGFWAGIEELKFYMAVNCCKRDKKLRPSKVLTQKDSRTSGKRDQLVRKRLPERIPTHLEPAITLKFPSIWEVLFIVVMNM